MSEYNPFDKPLREIVVGDLAVLRTVHEGWYVEYKRQLPNAAGIAKSVAAFANTHGGWLFYGIDEGSRSDAVAGAFRGIERADVDASLQRIRQAVANSVTPTPHFESRVLWGPSHELGLGADHAILVLQVPQGRAAPYVHKSGVVYRRVADGSEPRPETDRYLLDQLWRRSEEVRRDYRRWLKRDLELSKEEARAPFLRLFISPDLWREQSTWLEIDTARAREIFASKHEAGETFSAMPFELVQKSGRGFIARQAGNDPHKLSATWLLSRDLTSEVILPLSLWHAQARQLPHQLAGYTNASSFAAALEAHQYDDVRVVDLNYVFTCLVSVLHLQGRLDAAAQRTGPLFVKAELINIWRVVPFLDVAEVVQHQAEFGVPMHLSEHEFAPPGRDPETFIQIPTFEEIETLAHRRFYQAASVFEYIAAAFGLETGMDGVEKDPDKPFIHFELLNAATRAQAAQAARSERGRGS